MIHSNSEEMLCCHGKASWGPVVMVTTANMSDADVTCFP